MQTFLSFDLFVTHFFLKKNACRFVICTLQRSAFRNQYLHETLKIGTLFFFDLT